MLLQIWRQQRAAPDNHCRLSRAFSYELRWAPIIGGTVGQWTTMPVTKTRPPTLVTGLMPGTTYAFQVRALIDGGYSDWSDSVTRMCL
jgi:hypothetical protein